MKFDTNLASLHAYLCADGYVIKNPPTQKHKYYRIGLRNTNLTLLKDFQKKFYVCFNKKPNLRKGRCEIGSKEIYTVLSKNYSFYSKCWKIPKLPKKLQKIWLKTFFDCEGCVFSIKGKNRHIEADSINKEGLKQVSNTLTELNIQNIFKIIKKRKLFRLFIYGKRNLIKFNNLIGFLHPRKKEKLLMAINSYMNYYWKTPKSKRELEFLIKTKARFKKPSTIHFHSIKKENLFKLKKLLQKAYDIDSKIYNGINSYGAKYFELCFYGAKHINKIKYLLF